MTREFFWGMLAGIALTLFLQFYVVTPARAHDDADWIARAGKKNAAGEWCCGKGDCGALDPKSVKTVSGGYEVHGFVTIEATGVRIRIDEFVPENEAQPSPDGAYWHCHRPDGTRRCFFAPPPGS